LFEAVSAANKVVRTASEADPLLKGSGTTLTAVVANGTQGTIVHVGDSRIYVVRNGKAFQMTRDHTLIGELIDRGHINRSAAEQHPLRHVLTQVIGTEGRLDPDVEELTLEGAHWLILATDGFSKSVTTEQLERLCLEEGTSTAERLCRSLMKAAAGASPDDVTVAVVRALPAVAGSCQM
jgi:serine/threonine protein phosphatase PrpC